MKKRIAGLTIICVLILSSITTSSADNTASPMITVNGESADMGAMLQKIDGENYVSLRIFASACGADGALWNRETREMHISYMGTEIIARENTPYIVSNGRYFYAPKGIIYSGGYVLAPLSTLCHAFAAAGDFNGDAITISTSGRALCSGDEFYSKDDLYWMSRIIHAEAQGEIFPGKIAVGNVVMNRLHSAEFPNNIYDIIFENSCGEQFSPAWDGAVYCTPSKESEIAAMIALEDQDITGGCLYFAAERVASACWAGRNRQYAFKLDNHIFFS